MMMVLVLCVMFCNVWAGDEDFKSVKAKAAKAKQERESKKIKDDYLKKLEKIKKECREKLAKVNEEYKKSLEVALVVETKKGNLEEAIKIKNAVKGLEGEKKVEKKKTVEEILLTTKWTSSGVRNGLVVTFHKNGILTTASGKSAKWKIDSKILYIKWHGDWDAAKVDQNKIVVRNKSNESYTWVAIKN